jgi:hypothetical protein
VVRDLNKRIAQAFACVHAEQKLKEDTKEAVGRRRTAGEYPVKKRPMRRAVMTACLLTVVVGIGYGIYLKPTAAISLDGNASVELEINRFDKVLSIAADSEEGQTLADALGIRFWDYQDAVTTILQSQNGPLWTQEEAPVVLAVTGTDEVQCARLLSGLQSCTAANWNTYCCLADPDEREAAQQLGLSWGKYSAYLELKSLTTSVTPEMVQNMSMAELRQWIGDLSQTEGEDSWIPGKGYCGGRRKGLE